MKLPLIAAVLVVLAMGSSAQADCGCQTHARRANHCGCNNVMCDPCNNPLRELVQGIGFTLKCGACKFQSGMNRLFRPVTFHGCGGHHRTEVSCGCGAEIPTEGYQFMGPTVDEHYHGIPQEVVPTPSGRMIPEESGPPAIPQPEVTVPTGSEPARFPTWKPASHRQTSHVQASPTARKTPTYFAPSRSR